MTYHRGPDFPHEYFVQKSIEAYFTGRGFILKPRKKNDKGADLLCAHPTTGERWHIEAKGVTKSPRVDFQTGIGQLIMRMSDPAVRHAIAVPDAPCFTDLIAQINPWIVECIGLHWLLVGQDGSVKIVEIDVEN